MKAIDFPHFNYDELPADVARDCRQVIKDYIAFHRRSLETAVEIGRKLIAIRDRLAHGEFLRWIEAGFGSKSTAYRLINLAEGLDPSELPRLGSFDLGTVHAIASAPSDARQEIMSKIGSGEQLPPRKIKRMVANARAKERQAKAEAKLTEQERARRDQKERRTRQSREKREAEWAKQRAESEAAHKRRFESDRLAVEFLKKKLDADSLREFAELMRGSNSDTAHFGSSDFQHFLAKVAGFDVPRWWEDRCRRMAPQESGTGGGHE
jgi:hypothetical protein